MPTRAQRKAAAQKGSPPQRKDKPTKGATLAVAPSKPKLKAEPPSETSKKTPLPKPRPADERPGDRIVEASFEAGATELKLFPPPAFSEIAFAGRSNVGKSSLMNCLTGRRNLVRTSSTPGCTRQVAWFRTTSDDKSIVDLVDLPGYGYAKRSKTERGHWADLIETYLMERPTLRGVVLLVDIRRGIEDDDLDLLEMLRSPPRTSRPPLETVIVATKLDKLSSSAQKTALFKLSQAAGTKVLGFSSVTAQGRVPLWRTLRQIAGVGAVEEPTVEESSPAALDP